MVPPADIAWLWHCHRLAPEDYSRYCEDRFSKPALEANPPFTLAEAEPDSNRVAATQALWDKLYPKGPFFLEKNDDEATVYPSRIARDLAEELLASTKAQAAFLWQVSGPHFQDIDFLEQGVENYLKFLKLKPSDGLPIVPTYQIDLIWHTHILVSLSAYQQDCLTIRGVSLHHDDSLNDRTPGAKLDVAFQATAKLWTEQYGEAYLVEGGMYRGEPPLAFYDYESWTPDDGADGGDQIKLLAVQGISAGASSKAKEVNPLEGLDWVDPKQLGVADPTTGQPAFLPASTRSKIVGVNNNPVKQGYIFGSESAGAGYYAFCTRDAYQIAYRRLSKKAAFVECSLNMYDCFNCICFPWSQPTASQIAKKDELANELNEVLDLKAFVKARHLAEGPYTIITQPDIKRHHDRPASSLLLAEGAYVNYTPVYFTSADVWAGGGCGGGTRACGCGGGACGAAGCG